MKIPALHIPLGASGFQSLRLVQRALVCLTLGALVFAGWSWMKTQELEQAARHYEDATARVIDRTQAFKAEASVAGIQLTEERLQDLGREVSFANQVLAKQAFSWTRLLSDLEEAIPKRVSLGSVHLNFKDSTITLQGAARTLQDLTALVNELEGHPSFRNVMLAQHQIQGDSTPVSGDGGRKDPATIVSFSLSAAYHPAM